MVLLDACFIIGLRDCGKTHLLLEVAQRLSWNMYIPKAAYEECIAKKDDQILCKMISEGTIIICESPPDIFSKYRNRYSSLGDGEIDALAFALSPERKGGNPIMMVTSDKRTIRVAKDLNVKTITTLDFFKYVYQLGLMTKEEMYRFAPTLKENMWLSDKVLGDFLKGIS